MGVPPLVSTSTGLSKLTVATTVSPSLSQPPSPLVEDVSAINSTSAGPASMVMVYWALGAPMLPAMSVSSALSA